MYTHHIIRFGNDWYVVRTLPRVICKQAWGCSQSTCHDEGILRGFPCLIITVKILNSETKL